MDLSLVVIIATTAAVCAGVVFTLRAFKASARDASAESDGRQPAEAARTVASPHDAATTELLKRFFEGKECAICKRPIPPVHRTGLKPGLLNPATHETRSWDQIPKENLSKTLETQLPVCSSCEVAETFRQHHAALVVDRGRSSPDAQSPDRIASGS